MTISGRMVKWSIELSEFLPKKSIKAQMLADFIIECSFCIQPIVFQQKESNEEASIHTEYEAESILAISG